MSRNRRLVVALVVIAFVGVCTWQAVMETVIANRIPDSIKQEILCEYKFIGTNGIAWRAKHQEGDTAFYVTEWRYPSTVPHTNVDIFRVIWGGEPRLSHWRLMWFGGKFEADASYSLITASDPKDQRPFEQFAVGTALDRKVASVVGVTRDGRKTQAICFDGYWWMTAKMDPATYVQDKWVEMQALDAGGSVIYRCVPRYPGIPCEPSPAEPR